MYIVKDLKDFELNSQQRIFVDFIKDKIGSYCSYEKISNKNYQQFYASRQNDFLIYNTSMPCAEPVRLLRKNYKSTY